jgi:hypothetical protein
MSFNRWVYVSNNPINLVDPSGYIEESEGQRAEDIFARLMAKSIRIDKDWGIKYYHVPRTNFVHTCGWQEGDWRLIELVLLEEAANRLDQVLGGRIQAALGSVKVDKWDINKGAMAPPSPFNELVGDVVMLHDLGSNPNSKQELAYKWTFVHEMGHVWDYRSGSQISFGLMQRLNTWVCTLDPSPRCYWDPYHATEDPVSGQLVYPEPPPDTLVQCLNSLPGPSNPIPECQTLPYGSTYGEAGPFWTRPGAEDWATTLAYYTYQDYKQGEVIGLQSGSIRESYVKEQIAHLP